MTKNDKASKLDPATLDVVKRVLAMPPKKNEELKVGRPQGNKRRGPKGRASSSKPRGA
jgi:hypothetical protein